MTEGTDKTRAEYIAGLRKLADALEANEAMELPWSGGRVSEFSQYCHDRESMAAWVALLDDPKERTDGEWHEVSGRIDGIRVSVKIQTKNAGRRAVTRVVEQFEVEPFLPVPS